MPQQIQSKEYLQYFYKLNISMNEIVKCLLANEKLCKLIFYDETNIDDKPNLTNEQKDELIEKRLRTVPNIDFDDKVKTFIIIGFDDFSLNSTNPEFINQSISITIYCHKDIWKINNGQLRPFLILNEIHQVLCGSRDFGIGRLMLASGGLSVLSSEMAGYIIKYISTDFNL